MCENKCESDEIYFVDPKTKTETCHSVKDDKDLESINGFTMIKARQAMKYILSNDPNWDEFGPDDAVS